MSEMVEDGNDSDGLQTLNWEMELGWVSIIENGSYLFETPWRGHATDKLLFSSPPSMCNSLYLSLFNISHSLPSTIVVVLHNLKQVAVIVALG